MSASSFHHRKLAHAGLALFMMLSTVHAQAKVGMAACNELKEFSIQAQVASCVAHAGCNIMFNLKKDCASAKAFLSKLTDVLAGRGEINNNDVFEANTPEITISELRPKVAAAMSARHAKRARAPRRSRHLLLRIPMKTLPLSASSSEAGTRTGLR